MNKLEIDYPCEFKLWVMYFYHHLSIYAKKIFKKIECHFKARVLTINISQVKR